MLAIGNLSSCIRLAACAVAVMAQARSIGAAAAAHTPLLPLPTRHCCRSLQAW